MSPLAAAISAAYGNSPGWNADGPLGTSAINAFGSLMSSGTARSNTSSYVKAFATMLLFDKNFNLVDASWRQVDNTASNLVELRHCTNI